MKRAALAAALALALTPAVARADGDPASDALVTGEISFPFDPPMSAGVARLLHRAVAEARETGRPIRVAVIAGRVDLGAVPALYGHPREYARFLAAELRAVYRGGLLIVMPAGFGVAGPPGRNAGALDGLATGASADDLGRAAVRAVQRLARAGGRPIPRVLADGRRRAGGWGGRVVIAVLLAGAIIVARRRIPSKT